MNLFSITKSGRLVLNLILPDLCIALDTIGHSTFLFKILPLLILITVFSPGFLPMFLTVRSSLSLWTPFLSLAALVLGFSAMWVLETPQTALLSLSPKFKIS